jgi:hypothetical protein
MGVIFYRSLATSVFSAPSVVNKAEETLTTEETEYTEEARRKLKI